MSREHDATADGSYVERLRWTRSSLIALPVAALFVAVGVLMVRDGEPWGVALAVGAGLFLLLEVIGPASRRVMLRVDPQGITLGTSPPWPERTTTALVTWDEIDAVVLWRQRTGYHIMRYIGLERRAGSPTMPGSAKGNLARRMISFFTPRGVSAQSAVDSRPVSTWSVDRDRLRTTISRFAPHVSVHDRW